MSLGSKFLTRITEAANLNEAAVDSAETKLDTPWTGLRNRLKRPYEKRIVEFFAILGVPGRYAANEDGIEDTIRSAADVLRRPGRKQTLFNALFEQMKTTGNTVTEKKRGGRFQKIMEAVMVALGFPEHLVSVEGASPLGSTLGRAANRIEADASLQQTLVLFAKALGIGSAEINEGAQADPAFGGNKSEYFEKADGGHVVVLFDREFDIWRALDHDKSGDLTDWKDADGDTPESKSKVMNWAKEQGAIIKEEKAIGYFSRKLQKAAKLAEDIESNDPFISTALALAVALGIPEKNLKMQQSTVMKSLRDKKMTLSNRSILQQKMEAMIGMLAKSSTGQPSTQGASMAVENLSEAFAPLEAMISKDAKAHDLMEPNSGPCMSATYEGSGNHEDTMLFIGLDSKAPQNKPIAVAISGPWDGTVHTKYFADTKEGYRAAVEYANILRTVNLKSGGRPKGWTE